MYGRRLERLPLDTKAPGIDLRLFPNRSNRLAYHLQCYTPAGLHRYLRDHAHEFDVAHLHACRNLPGAIAAHYLTRYGVPYVIQPNGTAPVIERRQTLKRIFDTLAGRRMMRDAAAIVAVTEAERDQLLALGVPDDKIRLVPNPVDVQRARAARDPRSRRSTDDGSESATVSATRLWWCSSARSRRASVLMF